MIQGQIPEPVFSPDFAADSTSSAAAISITGVECFLFGGGFDASSLARYLFATGTSSDGELEVRDIASVPGAGAAPRELRRCFQNGNHLVLICADTKAEANQAASHLMNLLDAGDAAPELILFDGKDCLFSALATVATMRGAYDSVRLLCMERHSDKSLSATDAANFSFFSISVSSILSSNPSSEEALAIIPPADLSTVSATHTRDFEESDLRHHGYPWSAVSLVVTSARTSDSVVKTVSEKSWRKTRLLRMLIRD